MFSSEVSLRELQGQVQDNWTHDEKHSQILWLESGYHNEYSSRERRMQLSFSLLSRPSCDKSLLPLVHPTRTTWHRVGRASLEPTTQVGCLCCSNDEIQESYSVHRLHRLTSGQANDHKLSLLGICLSCHDHGESLNGGVHLPWHHFRQFQ